MADTNTKSLLHFDSIGTTIVDEVAGNVWTNTGYGTVSNTGSKFGGSSLFFRQKLSPSKTTTNVTTQTEMVNDVLTDPVSFISIPDAVGLLVLDGATNWTIEGWFYPTYDVTDNRIVGGDAVNGYRYFNRQQAVRDNYSPTLFRKGSVSGLTLDINISTQKLMAYIGDNGTDYYNTMGHQRPSTDAKQGFTVGDMPPNQWYHIAVQRSSAINSAGSSTYTPISDWIFIWINGTMKFAFDWTLMSVYDNVNEKLYVGGFESAYNQMNWSGYIDEFRFSDKARYTVIAAPKIDFEKYGSQNQQNWTELIDARGSNFVPPKAPFSLTGGVPLRNKATITGGLM